MYIQDTEVEAEGLLMG